MQVTIEATPPKAPALPCQTRGVKPTRCYVLYQKFHQKGLAISSIIHQPPCIGACSYVCQQGCQYTDQSGCRVKRRASAGTVVNLKDKLDLEDSAHCLRCSPLSLSSNQGRAPSCRKARKSNPLIVMYCSRYRHPDSDKELMGELMQLGKAFAAKFRNYCWHS
jgi:hypothetical protein